MKNFFKLLIIVGLSVFFYDNAKAQSDVFIDRNGYLIYFGVYGWFFQPCDDSSIEIYDALNQASFGVVYGTDGYNNPLRNFENTQYNSMNFDTIFYWRVGVDENYVGEIRYCYVKMFYKRRAVLLNHVESIPMCMLEIAQLKNEEKKYRLGCLWFNAEVDKIIPLRCP